MRRRKLIGLLIVRWGFAGMVGVAVAFGFLAAVTVAPPTDLPTIALGAMPVYRVEVGAAVFFGLYVATMTFVLATHNRGFTDVGTGGIKAQDLAAVDDAGSEELVLELMNEIRDLQTWREEGENVN